MRPRIKILLLAENEDQLGLWRFRLETAGRYAVLGATDPMTALELVVEYPDCRIAAAMNADHVAILRMAVQLDSVLLFGVTFLLGPCLAHRLVLDRGDGHHVEEVRWAVREMAARKRGPMRRAVQYEGSPSLYALLEERDAGRACGRSAA